MMRKNNHQLKVVCLIKVVVLLLAFSFQAVAQHGIKKVKDAPIAPAKPSVGALLVVTDQKAAEVFLNNKKIGVTNSEGELVLTSVKPGAYVIVIKRAEYEDYKEQITVVAGKPSTVNTKLKPTFAMIVLNFTELEQGIKVSLDGTLLTPEKFVVDLESKTVKMKTSPGEHELSVSRQGYLSLNTKIKAVTEEDNLIPVSLERLPINLTIKSLAGARFYLNGEANGKIPTTGLLKISTLKPNKTYRIRMELEDYEPKEQEITTEIEKDLELDLNLVPLPTSAAFSDTFLSGMTFWNAPKSWRAENGLLFIKGEIGVGLPKGKIYRDCNISFGLRINKSSGAAWVVRARDEKNYYLFYLGGTTGQFANQFRVYICRDGVYNLEAPADPGLPLPVVLKLGEDYRIRIQISGNVIQHWITPSNVGEEYSLGLFRDPSNSFPIGGMGFALLPEQDFLVNAFDVSLPTDVKAVR